jgi:hypothetical protein
MAAGTWNGNGFVPARPSAWSLFDLGFADARVITRAGRYELAAIADGSADAHRLAAIPLGGDEYFLLENRVEDPNGNGRFDFNDTDDDSLFSFYVDDYAGAEFDYYLPGEGTGSGLYIWHIDPSTIEANFVSNTVVADALHKGVDLEEADGIQDLDGYPVSAESFGSPGDAFRAGNRTRFGPETIPGTGSSFGVPTFAALDSVSAAGPVMAFSVSFDRRKAGAWPVVLPGPVGGNHPAVADLLPSSPGLEVVVADTTGGVWVLAADGTQPLGSPLARVGPDLATSPAIGDIDGDEKPEIVVVATDGAVYAWNGEDGDPATTGVWARAGRSLQGAVPVLARMWEPLELPPVGLSVIMGSPADSTGAGEILWLKQMGSAVAVRRVAVPGDATAPPLVFTGHDPALVLASVVAADRTRFFAVDMLAGTAVELERARAGLQHAVRTLVAGDLDGDGTFEVVASDDHGLIEAYATGAPIAGGEEPLDQLRALPGWPFDLGLGVAHDLALADIDRDGRVEVLVSAFDGRLYAINFNGTPQLFFPKPVGWPDRPIPRLAPSPLALDLGGDSTPEVVFAPGDGRAFALDGAGRPLDGWPLPGPAGRGTSPVIEDLDGDGRLDLVVPSDLETTSAAGSVLVAYDLGTAEGTGSVWRSYRGGPEHRGILGGPAASPDPQSFLSQVYVYPNPVAGGLATIHFSLGAEARVRLEILDAVGRVVARPAAADPAPGRTDHEVRWDARDAASGVYLVRLTAEGQGRRAIELRPFAVTR